MGGLKKRLGRRIDRLLRRWLDARIDRVLDEDAANLRRALQREACRETAEWLLANVPLHLEFEDRLALLAHAAREVAGREGLFLEFGVYQGGTINFLAERLPETTLYGFDSWQGLSEPWLYRGPGAFGDIEGAPEVRPNVRLVSGRFEDSLPPFLEEHPGPVRFLHVDSDLYSSARTVLRHLAGRFAPGTTIVFDEYFNYPGWRRGEHLAWTEICEERRIAFDYVGYSWRWSRKRLGGQQLAVTVTGVGGGRR